MCRNINERTTFMYVFPFHTCEVPLKNGLITQPYSFFMNCVSCLILLYFNQTIKTNYVYYSLVMILLFELWHAFSHLIHIPNSLQVNVVHGLVYMVNFSYLYTMIQYTKKVPSMVYCLLYCVIILFDLYAFSYLTFLYYFNTQLALFCTIACSFQKTPLGPYFQALYPFIGVLVLLFINEYFFCETMLSYHLLPYHVIPEIIGSVIFWKIGSIYQTLDQHILSRETC